MQAIVNGDALAQGEGVLADHRLSIGELPLNAQHWLEGYAPVPEPCNRCNVASKLSDQMLQPIPRRQTQNIECKRSHRGQYNTVLPGSFIKISLLPETLLPAILTAQH